MLSEAGEIGVNVDEAEQTLKTSEKLMQENKFEEAIDAALQSQQMIETIRENHQNASDKLFKLQLSQKKIPKEQLHY